MHHEPISSHDLNGHAEMDGIWWPVANGNGSAHRDAERGALAPHVVAHPGAEEIWGTAQAAPPIRIRSSEEPVSDEIWGSALRTGLAEAPALESVWGDRPEVTPASPGAVRRRTFLLPDTWAASPRRPMWRKRLDAFGRLSRRTG